MQRYLCIALYNDSMLVRLSFMMIWDIAELGSTVKNELMKSQLHVRRKAVQNRLGNTKNVLESCWKLAGNWLKMHQVS